MTAHLPFDAAVVAVLKEYGADCVVVPVPADELAVAEILPASALVAVAAKVQTTLPPAGNTAGSDPGQTAATGSAPPDNVTKTEVIESGAVLGFATVTSPVTVLAAPDCVRVADTVYRT